MQSKLKKIAVQLLDADERAEHFFYRYFNRFLFYLKGVRYGKNMQIFNKIYLTILRGGRLIIGDNFTFTSGGGLNPLCRNIRGKIFIDKNATIKIGNNSGISSACLWAKNKIVIGNFVNIGGDCIVMDTDAHNLDWKIRVGLECDSNGNIISDTATAVSAPIIIKDCAFIGSRCIILKGVTIGARSIVAAGSVVSNSIPDDCIAGGNPCKIIRYINDKTES